MSEPGPKLTVDPWRGPACGKESADWGPAAIFKYARERGHVTNDPFRNNEELAIGEHDPLAYHKGRIGARG